MGGYKMLSLIKITDNGGKTLDRYTAYFTDNLMLMMSHHCKSPQGVCLSDTSKPEYIRNDTGKNVIFSKLPEQVRQAIKEFMV